MDRETRDARCVVAREPQPAAQWERDSALFFQHSTLGSWKDCWRIAPWVIVLSWIPVWNMARANGSELLAAAGAALGTAPAAESAPPETSGPPESGPANGVGPQAPQGARKKASAKPQDAVNPQTRRAIDRGLEYVVRAQDRQGSWTNQESTDEYPVAMTALAGIALMMDGNTPTQGRYAPNVDRATTYLQRSQLPNGLFARSEVSTRPMHGHGFAVLYLSQVLGVIEDPGRAAQIRDQLDRAIRLIGDSQSQLGGWLYQPDSRSDEGSVTVTQVQALRSCRNVGLAVPKSVIDLAMEYLAKSQNSDGGIRYTAATRGESRPAITAAAVCCWYNAGEYESPRAAQALAYCKSDRISPRGTVGGHDYYAHLYYAQALFTSNDPDWDDYYPQRRDLLLEHQRPDGSWMEQVGDIYSTSIALIILQLPFQQLPIMQR